MANELELKIKKELRLCWSLPLIKAYANSFSNLLDYETFKAFLTSLGPRIGKYVCLYYGLNVFSMRQIANGRYKISNAFAIRITNFILNIINSM